jgi:hypothetical protein
VKRLVASSVLCAGCSLAFPMSEYDEGGGNVAGAGGNLAGAGGNLAGAGGQLDCGTFSNPPLSDLQHDFEGELGPDLALHPACGSIDNGQLVFDPALMNEYCWIYNVSAHRLTCDALTLRLIEAGSQENGMQRFIYLNAFGTDDDVFVLQEVNAFNFMGLDTVESSFNPVDDTWWRLRADLDTLFFETSADGATWNLKGTGTAPFSLDSVLVRIGAGTWQEVTNPMPVSYDCLNLPPPCP